MKPKRVAIWGAGRLFDSLVVHGGFDASHALAPDRQTPAEARRRALRPHAARRRRRWRAAVRTWSIVMSRGFAARSLPKRASWRRARKSSLYSDLLARARTCARRRDAPRAVCHAALAQLASPTSSRRNRNARRVSCASMRSQRSIMPVPAIPAARSPAPIFSPACSAPN